MANSTRIAIAAVKAQALRDAAWDIVRGASLLPPPRGEHPAVVWLRERADQLEEQARSDADR